MRKLNFENNKPLSRLVKALIILLFVFLVIDCYETLDIGLKSDRIKMFESKICSSRGSCNKTNLESDPNNCTCDCKPGFYSLNIDSKTKFDNIDIQCNVPRKSKFVAMFLCIFIPIGTHFLYLEKFALFGISLAMCLISIFGNCARFTMSNTGEVSYFRNKWNLLFAAIGIIMILLFTMSFIFILFDIEKDGHDQLMHNDLKDLFSSLFSG